MGSRIEVFYWRERNREVDFALRQGKTIVAVEAQSGRARHSLSGVDAFSRLFKPKRKLLVGPQGVSIDEFLSTPVERWLRE